MDDVKAVEIRNYISGRFKIHTIDLPQISKTKIHIFRRYVKIFNSDIELLKLRESGKPLSIGSTMVSLG